MAKFFRKAWPHFLILGGLVLFVLAAPSIYARYFVTKGKPISLNLPPEIRQVQYHIERLDKYDEQGTYQLQGRAFLTLDKAIPSGEYEQQVVLFSVTDYQVYSAELTTRTDVQNFFSDLGMDLSLLGFKTLLAKDTIAVGTYNIGLIFKHTSNGTTFLVRTNRCITRTPNFLLLVDANSLECNALISQWQGMPVQTTGELPAVTAQAKFWVDGLEIYNDDLYRLFGWAFLTVDQQTPASDYERKIVLTSENQNLFFLADQVARPDVQEHFINTGMNLIQAGFSTLIHRDAVEPGKYCIGVILEDNAKNQAFYIPTRRCLTRTPDRLILENPEDSDCCFLALPSLIVSDEGQPVEVNGQFPVKTDEAKLWVEGLDVRENGTYRLWGWAFLTIDPTIKAGDYERRIVLFNPFGNYTFLADSSSRPDVQKHFSDLGMDLNVSGFSSLIAEEALAQGPYRLGIIFKHASTNAAFFVDMHRCITHTGQELVLENSNSKACDFDVTTESSIGKPVETNVQLPPETTDAKWWVEGLDIQENNVYRLWGWAFLTTDATVPAGTYERQIVLAAGGMNFVFPATASLRSDVQAKFSDLGMDLNLSGFSVLISKNALGPGVYQIGFIFRNPTTANSLYVNANRCLTLNDNLLVLENYGSASCKPSLP